MLYEVRRKMTKIEEEKVDAHFPLALHGPKLANADADHTQPKPQQKGINKCEKKKPLPQSIGTPVSADLHIIHRLFFSKHNAKSSSLVNRSR